MGRRTSARGAAFTLAVIECERCLRWVHEWLTFEVRAEQYALTLDTCLDCAETPWHVLAGDIAAGRVRVYCHLAGPRRLRSG
jgi:hypothetical protein